jgi:2-oxoglutarate dehydrogenase complex dehydrogenase (E1) component-like enzyme
LSILEVRGHHLASLDPLNFYTPRQYDMPPPPETQLQYYGFTEVCRISLINFFPSLRSL